MGNHMTKECISGRCWVNGDSEKRERASGYVNETTSQLCIQLAWRNSSATGLHVSINTNTWCWNMFTAVLASSLLNVSSSPSLFCPVPLVLQDYIDAHPETIILDPLPAIRTLLDRCRSYQLVHRIEDCMRGNMIQHPWPHSSTIHEKSFMQFSSFANGVMPNYKKQSGPSS